MYTSAGIGTASRRLEVRDGGYIVGVLVQCNYGARPDFRVAGVPVGREIADLMPCIATADTSVRRGTRRCDSATEAPRSGSETVEQGSIIVVVATDAPLLPHQLKRLVTRVALGVGRTGGSGGHSPGVLLLAISPPTT